MNARLTSCRRWLRHGTGYCSRPSSPRLTIPRTTGAYAFITCGGEKFSLIRMASSAWQAKRRVKVDLHSRVPGSRAPAVPARVHLAVAKTVSVSSASIRA